MREEEIITASQPVVVCALTEGERVGSGQRVADGYQTSAAREKRDRLTALQEQLSQLRYAASGTAGEDTTQTDDAIEKALGELAALTARRDLTEADDVMSELQPLVLRRSVTADDAARMEGRIAELESQISALSAETEQSAEAVTVESAGYFSEQTDGLERVLTPESVLQMKPSELRAAAQHASAVPGNAVGRLITGQKWYFAAEIPEARAEQTAAGETLTVSFGLEKLSQIRMQVEAISEAEDGVCTIVLSCEREPQEVTALRRQSADIIFSSYTGLRVPKQALYMVDGQAGVYVLEGARARWKPVEILYAAAARAAGRDPADIRLCAATKMNDSAAVREAIAAGVDCCGENRVQELVKKLDEHAYDGAPVHFIGALQRNKVRQVVGQVDVIESVDRRELLADINAEAAKRGIVQDILLEVNAGGEKQKSGFLLKEFPRIVEEMADYPAVRVRGLMTVPPIGRKKGDNCRYFQKIRRIAVDITAQKYDNIFMDFLSMGMTDDFEDAIACGSTMVRIGTAIFGPRNYAPVKSD